MKLYRILNNALRAGMLELEENEEFGVIHVAPFQSLEDWIFTLNSSFGELDLDLSNGLAIAEIELDENEVVTIMSDALHLDNAIRSVTAKEASEERGLVDIRLTRSQIKNVSYKYVSDVEELEDSISIQHTNIDMSMNDYGYDADGNRDFYEDDFIFEEFYGKMVTCSFGDLMTHFSPRSQLFKTIDKPKCIFDYCVMIPMKVDGGEIGYSVIENMFEGDRLSPKSITREISFVLRNKVDLGFIPKKHPIFERIGGMGTRKIDYTSKLALVYSLRALIGTMPFEEVCDELFELYTELS